MGKKKQVVNEFKILQTHKKKEREREGWEKSTVKVLKKIWKICQAFEHHSKFDLAKVGVRMCLNSLS